MTGQINYRDGKGWGVNGERKGEGRRMGEGLCYRYVISVPALLPCGGNTEYSNDTVQSRDSDWGLCSIVSFLVSVCV